MDAHLTDHTSRFVVVVVVLAKINGGYLSFFAGRVAMCRIMSAERERERDVS